MMSYNAVVTILMFTIVGMICQECKGSTGDCRLDDDLSNVQQDRCIKQGERFIKKLLDEVKAPSRRRKRFNICESFAPFKECIEPIIERCSRIDNHLLKHWQIIFEVLQCGCNGTESCKTSLNCFVDQMRGKLGRQCDALYRFNSQQDTQDRCHFLYENVRCKEALVESACSPESGVFAFHIAKIASRSHLQRYGCVINRDKPYNGFRYTDACPSNLTKVIEMCEQTHLNDKLQFRVDNDLIPSTSRRQMREACSSYNTYKECVATLESECKHGLNKVYDFDGDLRTYLLKMDYICEYGKKGFNQHLKCYKAVLENNTLSRCNHIWQELEPTLARINAHSFYCLKASNTTLELRSALSRLRGCYEEVFASSCEGGGGVVAELMERAFEDPVYLKKKFQPNCALHSGPPFATGAPPTVAPSRSPQSAYTPPRKTAQRHKQPEQSDSPSSSSSSSAPAAGATYVCGVLLRLILMSVTVRQFFLMYS